MLRRHVLRTCTAECPTRLHTWYVTAPRLCVCVSVCLCVCRALSPPLSLSHSISMTVCQCVSVCLCVCVVGHASFFSYADVRLNMMVLLPHSKQRYPTTASTVHQNFQPLRFYCSTIDAAVLPG